LKRAVGTRQLIGQAQGILMERLKVTDERAFGLLVRASQDTNRKLVDIAAELVATGGLPSS
jgi:AmiR/NasT family two-component response regulator